MKTIYTLIEDIYKVVEGNGGWDQTVSTFFKEEMGGVLESRLNREDQPRGTLRMSNLGTPCQRKLWYEVNNAGEGEALRPSTRIKFLYGDMLEVLLLNLARAAGHTVEGTQGELSILGVKGHRDAVIDGITIDVKSASSYGFRKFQDGNLRNDDPFGYISQLSSYVYAGRQGETKVHPTLGAFLVINKENGELCLDMYDFAGELENKENEVQSLISMATQPQPPERAFAPSPDGQSGNLKLGVNCSYCSFKKLCYPDLRTFIYSNGPRYLTHVAKVPNVPEAT